MCCTNGARAVLKHAGPRTPGYRNGERRGGSSEVCGRRMPSGNREIQGLLRRDLVDGLQKLALLGTGNSWRDDAELVPAVGQGLCASPQLLQPAPVPDVREQRLGVVRGVEDQQGDLAGTGVSLRSNDRAGVALVLEVDRWAKWHGPLSGWLPGSKEIPTELRKLGTWLPREHSTGLAGLPLGVCHVL